MIKLLVIADDFTGALDTGIQFKARNTLVRVCNADPQNIFNALSEDIQVFIVVAETRHMNPKEAGEIVEQIVRQAQELDIPYIYKKTDSALRGNIGSELSAMLSASPEDSLHFIPAFPKMGRTTVNGVHYIDRIPVAESVFGSDLFEPVQFSHVKDIIAQQSSVETHLICTVEERDIAKGVLIYDAETDEDLFRIAHRLKEKNQLRLLAGCAGFAALLPKLLDLEQCCYNPTPMCPHFLTVCGSINPITLEQLEAAERSGFFRIRLTLKQKMDTSWRDSEEGKREIFQWMNTLQNCSAAIIDCGGQREAEEIWEYARVNKIEIENIRCTIAKAVAKIVERLIGNGLEATLLVTGGDTLLALMRELHQDSLVPVCELAPGVVLSRIQYREKEISLISKSGGFGSTDLLCDLAEKIIPDSKEEMVC